MARSAGDGVVLDALGGLLEGGLDDSREVGFVETVEVPLEDPVEGVAGCNPGAAMEDGLTAFLAGAVECGLASLPCLDVSGLRM